MQFYLYFLVSNSRLDRKPVRSLHSQAKTARQGEHIRAAELRVATWTVLFWGWGVTAGFNAVFLGNGKLKIAGAGGGHLANM